LVAPNLLARHFLHMTVDISAPFPNISTVLLDTGAMESLSGYR